MAVEDELRREQRKMSDTLSHKQRVIEAQEHRIAALDATNNRLLTALAQLKERYQAAESLASPSQRLLSSLTELQSSSCWATSVIYSICVTSLFMYRWRNIFILGVQNAFLELTLYLCCYKFVKEL